MKKNIFLVFLLLFSSTFLYAEWKKGEMFNRTSVDEDIKVTLTAIASQNNSDIIFGKDIVGNESLSIKDMPLEGAFNMILEKHGLDYRWEGNTIIVKISKTDVKQQSYIILEKLTITKLKSLMKKYGLYDKLVSQIVFDNEMNSIFITADFTTIKELETLIKRFEKAEEIKQLEAAEKNKLAEENKIKNRANAIRLLQDRKKEKYGQSKYDNWNMVLDVIRLKYINVSSTEMEFQGKTVQVESLEETLKGLLGTGYMNVGNNEFALSDTNSTQFVNINYKSEAEKPYLKIDKRTNSIIVKDYPDRVEEIKAIIEKIDRPIKLIKIDVIVAVGNTGFTRELGVNLGGSQILGDHTSHTSGANLEQGGHTLTLNSANGLGFSASMLYTGARNVLNASLHAMEKNNLGKILSNPTVVTLNNKEAEVYSGNSISVKTGTTATNDKSAIATISTLETITTGVSIRVTPHVIEKLGGDDDKEIILDIEIENSNFGNANENRIDSSKSTIKTSVIIKNNKTLILGGLFSYSEGNDENGIPVLKDIPILGYLFKTKNKNLNKNELIFFITPQIITTDMIMDSKYNHYNADLKSNQDKLNKDLKNIRKSNLDLANEKYKKGKL